MLVWPTKLIVTCFQTCWLKNMDITVFPFLEIIPLLWDSYPFLNSSLILASGGLFWTYHFFLNVIYGICHKLAFMLIMDFNLSLWLDGRCCQGLVPVVVYQPVHVAGCPADWSPPQCLLNCKASWMLCCLCADIWKPQNYSLSTLGSREFLPWLLPRLDVFISWAALVSLCIWKRMVSGWDLDF